MNCLNHIDREGQRVVAWRDSIFVFCPYCIDRWASLGIPIQVFPDVAETPLSRSSSSASGVFGSPVADHDIGPSAA